MLFLDITLTFRINMSFFHLLLLFEKGINLKHMSLLVSPYNLQTDPPNGNEVVV